MNVQQRFSFVFSSVILTTALLSSSSQAAVVVDDDFANDGTAATDARYYGSSTSGAIEINSNSIGLVSGSSGRQIHALFPTQTLALAGDTLTASVTFVTPNTVGSSTEDLKFGLFDHLGRGDIGGVLDQNTSYSTASPNADYNGLFGFSSEIDVESADPSTDLDMRRSNPSTSGRLLGTSTGFTSFSGSSGPDIGYSILANTSYTVGLTVTRDALGGLEITTDFAGSSLTVTDAAPGSYDFGLLGLGASTNAFGSSNSAGDPDNGIDITNVNIAFNSSAVPEPGSMAFLALGGLAGLARRRRR